jgi:L-aminopeptidase/D-esterase-like protein
MLNSITDVPGVEVGHAQDAAAGTGCTVILCRSGAVCGVDVRGGGPGTRETDCLAPENLIQEVHALYLGGGSAYGLAGADGVMRFLEDRGIGLDVGCGLVPIVPGAVLFDLPVGDSRRRPDAAMGYAACLAASSDEASMGNVGAGTGASIGKTRGTAFMMKGGLGTASLAVGDFVVGAIVAVNCFGDVLNPATGRIIAGTLDEAKTGFVSSLADILSASRPTNPLVANTTIGAVAVSGRLTKAQATKVAAMAHDGYARTINPIHTQYDGDTIFCLAAGSGTEGAGGPELDTSTVGVAAAEAMAAAVLRGVKAAASAYGLPGYSEMLERLGGDAAKDRREGRSDAI